MPRAQEIDHVCERIEEFGYKVHSIEGEERVVIGVVGVGDVTACLESLEATPGVERAVRISAPYKFVSREFKKEHTVLRVNGVEIGGDEFVVMAGPCSVESERQIMETAEGVAAAGAPHAARRRLQAAHFALRFPGHGTGRPEAAAQGQGGHRPRHRHRSDERPRRGAWWPSTPTCMQVGARNMQNFALLKSLGGCGRPVLLKRGMSSTIKELLMSAEYVVAHGNPNVMLCERGIRTFETATRNTCDISAVPVLNELTHLPVILDPSHATGKRSLVPALARAGVAIGADGLIVEVHPNPEKAVSDGAQSLTLEDFRAMMRQLRPYLDLWKEARLAETAAAV